MLLDVCGAFDRLWSQGLIYKLLKWRLPLRLLRCVASFVRERSLRVFEGSAISDEIIMKAGTPQGSIISPILFLLFMDDVKDDLPEGVIIYQFADDIALSTTASCPRLAKWRLQKGLEVIKKWTSKWRIELEPKKSNFLLFSRCPTHRRLSLNLNLHGIQIVETTKARFLGILLDNKLDWSCQIDDLLNRTMHKIHLLKNISAKDRWTNPRQVLKFFDAIITSIFAFVIPNCISMKASLWNKMDKAHARAVKSIAGVPNFTNYQTVCDHLGIEKWSLSLKRAALERIGGILRSSPVGNKMISNAPKSKQTYDSPVFQYLKYKLEERAA